MRKYILDTDIGDDIDDALALDLALKLKLDIVAITTVYRNVLDRARITKKMLFLHGSDIPVYQGYGSTLDGKNESYPLCQWTDDLSNERYAPLNSDPEDAIDAIIDLAKKHGKDLFILAIGPMTNVARAILKDKEVMSQIGGIILMGGDYVNHYVEWNIHCDVTAASIVFSSDLPIIAFGHEVTSLTRVTPYQQEKVFALSGSAYKEYLSQLARLWILSKAEGYRIILHDLLVVRYAAGDEFCKIKSIPVGLETKGEYTVGMTLNRSLVDLVEVERSHEIDVGYDVDGEEFCNYFIKKIDE